MLPIHILFLEICLASGLLNVVETGVRMVPQLVEVGQVRLVAAAAPGPGLAATRPPARGREAGGGRGEGRGQQLVHEADVGDGEAQRLYPRQPLLVGEGGHLGAQPVEGLVQVEHPPPLPDVCRPPLGRRRHSPPLLVRLL